MTEEAELTLVLWEALRHFYHEDQANAAVHTAEARYSPITFRLAEQLAKLGVTDGVVGIVMDDLGEYEEDHGR